MSNKNPIEEVYDELNPEDRKFCLKILELLAMKYHPENTDLKRYVEIGEEITKLSNKIEELIEVRKNLSEKLVNEKWE